MMRVVAGQAMQSSEHACPCTAEVRGEDARDDGDPERFEGDGTWRAPPMPWDEKSCIDDDAAAAVEEALSCLPPMMRAVLTLRDVEGLGAEDACAILDLGMTRQHSLLDRGRRRVREAVDRHVREHGRRRCPRSRFAGMG